jgi:hypothetical protein
MAIAYTYCVRDTPMPNGNQIPGTPIGSSSSPPNSPAITEANVTSGRIRIGPLRTISATVTSGSRLGSIALFVVIGAQFRYVAGGVTHLPQLLMSLDRGPGGSRETVPTVGYSGIPSPRGALTSWRAHGRIALAVSGMMSISAYSL